MIESTVRLQLPASSGYLVLARTAAAAVCARLDYPLDRLEDVKLAVDEACSLLLVDAVPGEDIFIELSPSPDGHLAISAATRTARGRVPKETSFAWTVLTALVEKVRATAVDGIVTIHLTAHRGEAVGSTAISSSARS